jgi:hypothetical protein
MLVYIFMMWLIQFSYGNQEGVDSTVYEAIESMLQRDSNYAKHAKCMTKHFEEKKIVDRFYLPGMEKDSSVMLEELKKFLPDAFDGCKSVDNDLTAKAPSSGSSLTSNWLMLAISATDQS